MLVVHTIEELQNALRGKDGIALVPTMGNLHDGHLALMAEAKKHAPTVVASIFVNRLQFGPNEDFDTYPRTLQEDLEKLEKQGAVDIVFAPSEKDMYPEKQTFMVRPDPNLSEILEGFYRPGFFDGVATVVNKLFSIVRPNVAVFGKKDYQQLKIIQSMVKQFGMPLKIIPMELQRNPETGLALSSRNRYLIAEELKEATHLYRTLHGVKSSLEAGAIDITGLENSAVKRLEEAGWKPDYIVVARQKDLLTPTRDDLFNKEPLVILGAAKIGTTRLIDNVEVFGKLA